MKTFVHIVVYTLLLSGFYSCNGDVFVDDIRPSVSELALDGNGDSAVVHFASSSWDRLTLRTGLDLPYTYKVYDADGNLMQEVQYPELVGMGRIECKDWVDFTVERITPQDVKITARENVLDFPLHLVVEASNEYEYQTVNVDIHPSERYVLERITYSLDVFSYEEQMREKSRSVTYNAGSGALSYTIFPYLNEYYKVEFVSDNPLAFKLLGQENLLVEVPVIKDGCLVMDGLQAVYATSQQDLPLPSSLSDTISVKVVVPPYTSMRNTLLLEYDWFETEYTLHVVQPRNGKRRSVNGLLQGRMPKGYFIKREIIHE